MALAVPEPSCRVRDLHTPLQSLSSAPSHFAVHACWTVRLCWALHVAQCSEQGRQHRWWEQSGRTSNRWCLHQSLWGPGGRQGLTGLRQGSGSSI